MTNTSFKPNVASTFLLILGALCLGFVFIIGSPRPTLGGDFAPYADDTVRAIAVQTDGRIVVGGRFHTIGGQSRSYLVRLMPNGTLDNSFNPVVGDKVWCLAIQSDNKILVGGQFATINGENRPALARLNPNGSLDGSFNANITQIPMVEGVVFSILVQPNEKIVIGGVFATVGGQPRSNIARLEPNGALDTTFSPGTNAEVNVIARQTDNKLLFGGHFTTLAGQPRAHIGRVNENGTIDAGFDPGAPHWIVAIVVQPDTKIVIGGEDQSGLTGYLTRLNENGTVDPSFDPLLPSDFGYVDSLALQADNKIIVGGNFTSIGGQTRTRLARLNADGSADSFNSPVNGEVWCITVQPDGKILIGGDFDSVAGKVTGHIARIHPGGRLDIGSRGFDFDGDGRADISVFRPSTGDWFLQLSAAGFYGGNFGTSTDRIAPAD